MPGRAAMRLTRRRATGAPTGSTSGRIIVGRLDPDGSPAVAVWWEHGCQTQSPPRIGVQYAGQSPAPIDIERVSW